MQDQQLVSIFLMALANLRDYPQVGKVERVAGFILTCEKVSPFTVEICSPSGQRRTYTQVEEPQRSAHRAAVRDRR